MSASEVISSKVQFGKISIRPYVDANYENMGLQNYNLVVYDNVAHEEQLACIELNGVRRYITGLNEFAPEVKMITNPEEKEARIKEIRTIVSQLEKELAFNLIDPADKDFWLKVKLLKPDNDEFWGKISMRCSNDPVVLEPDKNPMDIIKLYAIEARGFSIIAPSYEEARVASPQVKFYLDKTVETTSTKIESKMIRNTALAELQKLFDKNINKLFYVSKIVDANSVQYKKTTPNVVLYDNMDRFINGQGSEKNIGRSAQMFIDASRLNMETLKIRSIVKDASFYKFIAPKADGVIYHMDSNTIMGRNPSECVEFLTNPLNEKILEDLTKRVEEQWNK